MSIHTPFDATTLRRSTLQALSDGGVFDILIIGGGIHGAAVANLAARTGIKVALVEQSDFAAATSSRSSKMAHGGLRYLEMFDFQQVFEGIKAREELFAAAPHIVKPERFLIPIPKGSWFFKLKLKIGLILYDLLVKNRTRRHRWIDASELAGTGFESQKEQLNGCFEYTDGLLNDSRLVIEHIAGARAHGAVCANYIEVLKTTSATEGVASVECIDRVSGEILLLRTRLVVNCAGPWAPKFQGTGAAVGEVGQLAVKLSRGVHIIFNRPWKGPSLFLPMPGKARYYFVWPHPGGTMIGTTERETAVAEIDPLPRLDELEEIFKRIEKDLPNSGLTRDSAHYSFAGIRTLPLRDSKKNSAILSRKHIWKLSSSILSLVGGKYTTAVPTAWEGVRVAARFLGKGLPAAIPTGLYLNALSAENIVKLEQELQSCGVNSSHARRIANRYGQRAKVFLDHADWREELSPQVLAGEVIIAVTEEQAVSLEDVLRRRLDLEYCLGNGLSELESVARMIGASEAEMTQYRSRINGLLNLMHSVEK